jgi:hypothetical protein
VKLRGALATIVPADKKFLHGMSDAILVPSQGASRSREVKTDIHESGGDGGRANSATSESERQA